MNKTLRWTLLILSGLLTAFVGLYLILNVDELPKIAVKFIGIAFMFYGFGEIGNVAYELYVNNIKTCKHKNFTFSENKVLKCEKCNELFIDVINKKK